MLRCSRPTSIAATSQEFPRQTASPPGAVRGEPCLRPLESSFWRVAATRLGFVEHGEGGAPRLMFPVDAALNLPPELYSLPVRKRVAQLVSHVAFEPSLRSSRCRNA
jgi:hypothetical protein